MNDRVRNTPGWFWIVVLFALLFEASGCFLYWIQVSADPATMPVDQRSIREATPAWITAAYAIAVWVGLAAAVLLALRRRHAIALFFVSLIAVIVQFGGIFLIPDLRQMLPPDAYAGPIVIAVIAYGLWHFSRIASARGWIA